jgi:hypothetical protein
MTVIQLPDQQEAALKAKAAAQRLTLEAWLKRLADEEAFSAVPGSPQEAAARIFELHKRRLSKGCPFVWPTPPPTTRFSAWPNVTG